MCKTCTRFLHIAVVGNHVVDETFFSGKERKKKMNKYTITFGGDCIRFREWDENKKIKSNRQSAMNVHGWRKHMGNTCSSSNKTKQQWSV